MGRRMSELSEQQPTSSSSSSSSSCSSLTEALLLTTMCIIGLPVEVHIKDGSIFSGIFHTASFDKGFGIALKKARMIRKGTQNTNVSNNGLIDTLVIQPGDLVQVVAKGVMLPADYASSCATCNDEGSVSGSIGSCQGSVNGDSSNNEWRNLERQVGVGMPQDDEVAYGHHSEALKEVPKVNGSTASLSNGFNKLSVQKENHKVMAFNHTANGSLPFSDPSMDVKNVNQLQNKELASTQSVASEVSDSAKTKSAASRNSIAVPAGLTPQFPVGNRTAKESKLNPSAKVFSPSVPNFRSTPPLVPTVPSVAYVPNSVPAVQVAGAQPEVGIRPTVPRSSWPVKFVPYVASTAMSTDNGPHYNQPIGGHFVTRAQPVRHSVQYQPVQAVPSYVHSNLQNVCNGIYGRPGQLVYVHPVTHDVIQSPAAMSQAPHPYLTSHPIHLGVAKNEGIFSGLPLPASMTPPLMANGQQPFTMQSHINQLSQPLFTSVRPVSIVGHNIVYNSKFP